MLATAANRSGGQLGTLSQPVSWGLQPSGRMVFTVSRMVLTGSEPPDRPGCFYRMPIKYCNRTVEQQKQQSGSRLAMSRSYAWPLEWRYRGLYAGCYLAECIGTDSGLPAVLG